MPQGDKTEEEEEDTSPGHVRLVSSACTRLQLNLKQTLRLLSEVSATVSVLLYSTYPEYNLRIHEYSLRYFPGQIRDRTFFEIRPDTGLDLMSETP